MMEKTIFVLLAAFAAVYAATVPTGVEVPCSTLESHFATEGRRFFTNGEGAPFVTCNRLCLSARGRIMRYYYCCPGYDMVVLNDTSGRFILDGAVDRVFCIPAAKTEATSSTPASPTPKPVAKVESRECPSKGEPQSPSDFVYKIQVDLCRYSCVYQEVVDEQSELRNVTRIFYSCCPPHKAIAAGASLRPIYTCATKEEMASPTNNTEDAMGFTVTPAAVPASESPTTQRPTEVTDATKEPTDAPKVATTEALTTPPTTVAQTEAPTTPSPPVTQVPRCPNSNVPQTTNQFALNSQGKLCRTTCSYEEMDDLGFDSVTREVTRTIYSCCSPYNAVAVGATNRPVYECQ